jgi:hypothetical protein
MTDIKTVIARVHRANIGRYERLLRTRLTPVERQFVMRRLAEEKLELRRLQATTSPGSDDRRLRPEPAAARRQADQPAYA